MARCASSRTFAIYAMRLLFALLFSCSVASAVASDRPPTPDFSGYPQTEAFRCYLELQTNAARHLEHLLATTEFWHTGAIAIKYELSDHGRHVHSILEFPPCTANPNAYPPSLSETQLRMVNSAIRELPPTNTLPPIESLLLVSFRNGTNWITHSYDTRSLPRAIRQIYDIRPRIKWARDFTVQ